MKRIVLALIILSMATGTALAAQRALLQSPGMRVMLEDAFECGEPVHVLVEADRPELFEPEATELQRTMDAVRAMLRFECDGIPEIQIRGQLKGLEQSVYEAVVSASTDWLISVRQTIRTGDPDVLLEPAEQDPEPPKETVSPGLSVANLRTGMSVEEASAAVSGGFGVAPQHDPQTGLLTMYAQGCPEDFDWEALAPDPLPGWKCLRAWFTDERDSRLYRLELLQVVKAGGLSKVEQTLVKRFGDPEDSWSDTQDRGWFKGDREIQRMAWGEVVESVSAENAEDVQRPVYELQAALVVVGDAVATTMELYQPSLLPATTDDPDEQSIDLKL